MHELNIPEGIRHTKTGVIYPEGVTEEHLLAHGRFLAIAQRALNFWRCDWLRKTRAVCGEEGAVKMCQQLEMEFEDVRAAEKLLTLDVREEALLPEHHYVLSAAKLAVPEQQRWAAVAVREKLSPRELKSSIKAGVVLREKKGEDVHAGVPTPHAARMQYEFWRRETEELWAGWDEATLHMALQELRPIVDGHAELFRLWDEKESARERAEEAEAAEEEGR